MGRGEVVAGYEALLPAQRASSVNLTFLLREGDQLVAVIGDAGRRVFCNSLYACSFICNPVVDIRD